MTMPVAPSGQQHQIRYGDQVAVVTEVGATLRVYDVGGRPLIDGFGPGEVCSAGRGQHLIPWPNRVRDGRYTHAGKAQQLALTEPANGNAIHGLARWANWSLGPREDHVVTLTLALHPQPGWPGSLECSITTELGEDGLTVTTSAVNVGTASVPYGTGAHPYLTLGAATVDGTIVRVPATQVATPDDRGIPVDPGPVDGTPYDFRLARAIGDLVLDTAYTGLERDPDGRWRVHLDDAGTGWAATVWGDASYTWLQLFTGDTLHDGRARGGLAVEPMTCGPDAFNTGDGLIILEPGQSHQARWGVQPA